MTRAGVTRGSAEGGPVLLLASLLVSLLAAELLLRAFTLFPIHRRDANRRPHPALGYVMRPELEGIDAAGFRNPDDPRRVDLVAIGDSHTYGFNVARDESWPSLVASRLGLTVYNAGMGGYGILQYRWLFEELLDRSPRSVVLGLYPANDFADYCRFAELAYWRPRLAERELGVGGCADEGDDGDGGDGFGTETRGWRRLWLGTALGSAFDHLIWSELCPGNRDEVLPVRYGSHETRISKRRVRLHARFTDLRSEAIRNAVRAGEVFLEDMIGLATSSRTRFGVLFIPSKENALLASADTSDPFYRELEGAVRQERALAARFDRFLRDRGVTTAHALDCLQRRLDRRLYPRGVNGHPRAPGYRCYAEAALALLREPDAGPPGAAN